MRVGGRLGTVLAGMLLAGIFLTCNPCALALNPALDVSQYAHTSWKVRDGFTKGSITAIAQTTDGYLWLGTEFGLYRFDGVRNVPWQPPEGQSLPSGEITRLLVARDGTLWIGTRRGLASWKGSVFTLYNEVAGLSVFGLVEDREGSVWLTANGPPRSKLCQIQDGSTKCSTVAEKAEAGPFGLWSLYEDSQANLWLGGSAGIWHWKPGSPKYYPLGRQGNGFQGLAEGDDGTLLIAMAGGVRRLVEGKAEMAYPFPGPLEKSESLRILRDRDGGLWMGTSARGLVHVHQGRTDVFAASDGLSIDFISALFEDREGNIWVAGPGGLDRFRNVAVATFSTSQGLSNSIVMSVLVAADGSVWLSTRDGLNRWNHGQVTIYRERSAPTPRGVREVVGEGLPERGTQALSQDVRGRIWFVTQRGVGYMENDRFTSLSGVPGSNSSTIIGDTRGGVWIAIDEELLHIPERGQPEKIPWASLNLANTAPRLLADPQRDGLWLGFYQGNVAYFADGRIQALYTPANGLGRGTVANLRFDRGGALWAATEGGLSRIKDGRIATLSSKNGLPCDGVHWSVEDDAHSLWLFMPCGLARIAGAELDAWSVAADRNQDSKQTVHTTVFDSADGVRTRAIAGGYGPHIAQSRDGKLWFTATDGVSMIDPLHLPVNKLPPPVHVETVKVNGKELAATDGIELSHGDNDLEIDYTALSLTNPDRVRFRYKLEGKDRDWQDVGTRRQAYYGGLAPRKYRFRVMASNNDGLWNEAGAALNFNIAPAYYQTSWFQGLAVLAGAGMLWLLYRLRLRQATARVNLLYEERLAERTRIARDLHDTLLQSLAGVSLQLDGISKQAAAHPEKTPSMIARVREQVDSAFREARTKVWNLRSTSVEAQGLEGALRQLVERMAHAMTTPCNIAVTGQPRPCSPEIEEELLRIAQEAAHNANRHAQASEIRIGLDWATSSLTLSIADDGRGFDFEEGYGKSGHWGLKNMQERAAQIGGTCQITTAAGQGTQIEVRVPQSSWSLRNKLMRNTLAKHAHSSSDR